MTLLKSCATSLLLAATASFSYAAASTDSITVSGRIFNVPENGSRTAIINECDISDKSERRVVETDSLGWFCERIPFSSAHTFTVNYNRKLFINAFAEPGDSIHVEIDASKSPAEFHLSGSHADTNEIYSHAFQALAPIYYDVKLLPDATPYSEYMERFKSECAKTRTIVEDYITKNSVPNEIAQMLYADNIFSIANQAIGFRGANRDEQLAFFTDPIFDILNEANSRVMIFPYHLSALCRRFPELISQQPKGHIRDLMYASTKGKQKPPREDFADPAYYDRIYAVPPFGINIADIRTGDLLVMLNGSVTEIPNQNPLEWLTNHFHGRPIYLDASATWCGPCRAALTASEGVREHFKDSKIVFAVLWLKSDLEAWKKIAPTIHNAVHIFISDEDMSNRLMGNFKILGVPAYFFISPDGKVYREGVPSFHSPELPDFLRSKL